MRSRWIAAALFILLSPWLVRAAETGTDDGTAAASAAADALIQKLRSGDPAERASLLRDIVSQGEKAIPTVEQALRGADRGERRDLEAVLDRIFNEMIIRLESDDESASQAAADALLRAGPAALGALSKYRASRLPDWAERVSLLQRRIIDDLVQKLAGPGKEDALARLRAAGPLAAPLYMQLLSSEETPADVARLVEQTGRALIRNHLEGLASDRYAVRDAAEHALFEYGAFTIPDLELASRAESPQVRHFALRLIQRIRYQVSERLYNACGTLLEGFEGMPWRERRTLVNQIERLGGEESIPTLRRIVELDESFEVKLAAAQGLARLKDPYGIHWLESLHQGLRKLRESPEITAAIFMDQGLQYLKIKRYSRSIREFKKVLEIQPDNNTAHYNMACAYALWGKLDEAIQALRKAVEFGFSDIEHIEQDSDLDGIRDDPRFQEILEELRKQHPGDGP